MITSDLLSATLALTLVSFIATLYVIVRILTPLVGPHILSRYSRPTNPLPVFGYASSAPDKIQLRSAQRFQCWLAVVDLASSGVWLWEVVSLASGSPNSPARMAFAICARPTILLVVSLISYLNVIRGKVVNLGRFDFIVWIPSLVLLAIMISLAYVAPTSSSTVWIIMMAVETTLLTICSLCFGRLLLAVFRVRRDTVRSHMLRHRMMQEEKAAEHERALEEQEEEEARRRAAFPNEPPFLPPMKTNRWLISKTFLLKKASSAANTVHTSLHRRSQSGAATLAGRPSTASELPRLSFSSHEPAQMQGDPNVPYSFLNHDPASTTRFGHLRAQSNSQAESQLHNAHQSPSSPMPTPRAVSFDLDTAARGASPAPALSEGRFGTFSRMTDFSRISSDQPRPSMGSYMSYDSSSSESAGVAGYLSGGRLAYSNGQGRNPGLSRKEARKAGARMGGHLLNCVATWTLILPFLVYKMHQPGKPAPLYASILVALGLSLSGPLLALQTIIAEGGFWYAKSVPPLMASSSAVAFEHLQSRGGTPTPNLLVPNSASLTQPNSANTDRSQATAQSAAMSGGTVSSHRSSSSNDSVSSLASIAAFSNPVPGTFRHSLDTQEAPSTILGRALAMAAPHPKLQIMKAKQGGVRESANVENIDIEHGHLGDHDLHKRESRKLKAYSMSRNSVISLRSTASHHRERKRSNTIGLAEKSWDDLEAGGEFGLRTPNRRSALAMKDANSLTAAILAEKKRTPPRSPSISSFTFRSSQGASAHERRRSAPITPSSYRSMDESGVLVSRPGTASNYNIDSLTASLLTNMLPGMRISASAQSTSSKRNSLHRSKSRENASYASKYDMPRSSVSEKKRPNLSLDLHRDVPGGGDHQSLANRDRNNVQDSPTVHLAKASGNDAPGQGDPGRQGQHLRRRSNKSVSYILPSEEEEEREQRLLPIDESKVITRRGGKMRLSPSAELREKEEASRSLRPSIDVPPAPRPSLEDRSLEESFEMVEKVRPDNEGRVEILSDHGTAGLSGPGIAASPRAPSIIIRTKASVTSQYNDAADQEELGTVAMATRITRTPSVSSFGSDCTILRPLSLSASEVNAAANRSRSSTVGSLTSEGFRNMIQSNRTSWTGSELGNESISALLERQGALADAITSPTRNSFIALQARDKNASIEKSNTTVDDEKSPSASQVTTPTGTTFDNQASPQDRSMYVSPQRVQLSEVRSGRAQSINDENAPPAAALAMRPTQRNIQPSQNQRLPRLANQKSIMSLR